ncbi:divalent-cation tolerance protein CutA [Pseudescherichia vulneris NBRC 102420]|uniref:Divalent-cation tolerance protein CutA n=1 Tax=Pseudescherichia vulneris NBRC 102420 TaxID=1115515 RepID=A0A090UWJ3_PSEVU|nr:divalent cation tolerance protein CutA [Pseudescherichia vulneris]GAL56960.1 divalent-cation tolerance protein CutA [Pseudescherichia vulneris NBRC 102420]
MNTPDAVVVLCTAPDEATAQDLAAKVLADKLAACVTILPGATSLYYWEGKLEQEYEVQMLLKSTPAHQEALLACLKSHHPYQTPELLVLPVAYGDNDYLSWLNASLR